MKRVRISDLKAHLSEHLRAVEAGEVVEVTDRARPIARIAPIAENAEGLEIAPKQQPFASVRVVRLPALTLPKASLEALREERGTR